MKKMLILLLVAIMSGLGLSACGGPARGPLRQGLDFEKSVFAKVDEAGKVTFLDNPVYERGEVVHFALMNVGKFTPGEDGKDWVDLDLVLWDGGKKVYEKAGLLGEGGKVELKDDMAESPSGVFTATASLVSGQDYTMQLTVYDKIGGGIARDTGVFTIK